MLEIEVKIRVARPAAMLRRLKQCGYALKSDWQERNMVFDTQGLSLRSSGRLLRLRSERRKWLLTYKGRPVAGSRHKQREEIEIGVEEGPALQAILERLGFFQSLPMRSGAGLCTGEASRVMWSWTILLSEISWNWKGLRSGSIIPPYDWASDPAITSPSPMPNSIGSIARIEA